MNSVALNLHNDGATVTNNCCGHGVKVVSVNFLPIPSLQHTDLLAAAACFENHVVFALVEKTTGVVRRTIQSMKTSAPLISFCPTVSDSRVIFASEGDLSGSSFDIWRFEVGFMELRDCRKDKLDATIKYHVEDVGPVLVIAAGKKFLMAAMLYDIVIFDAGNFKILATINHFLGK
jgi:hypothetical protein